jgi:hypothetical protein
MQLVVCILAFLVLFAVERSERTTIEGVSETTAAIAKHISVSDNVGHKLRLLSQTKFTDDISHLMSDPRYDDDRSEDCVRRLRADVTRGDATDSDLDAFRRILLFAIAIVTLSIILSLFIYDLLGAKSGVALSWLGLAYK